MEFYTLLKKMEQKPFVLMGMACGILLMLGVYLSHKFQFLCAHSPLFSTFVPNSDECLALLITLVILRALLPRSPEMVRRIIPTTMGLIVPFMCTFPLKFIAISGRDNFGIRVVFYVIFTAKACDIGGIFAGKYFGRRKLVARISPNKTIEGAIGGILCSNVVGMAIALLHGSFLVAKLTFPGTIVSVVAASTLLAIFSMLGDFLESAIKRLAKEKDSGNILPGMGGIFDLTDSLLFALPLGTIFALHFLH
jgi:phosphatidate cytidylyltransferase